MNVLTDRFQSLDRLDMDTKSLERINRTAIQKLKSILTDKQFALYQELSAKKKLDKEKYLKEHPDFAFTTEDLQMDF
jgi:hypothetical protein